MGKRQIGQLQPSELVVTILLSQIAATPMQDNDLPMLNTVVALLVLAGAEIILSAIGMKSPKIRVLLEGSPVMIVNDGVVDQKQLSRLRYTVDDVVEALRQQGIFDISQVQYAVAETNGALSVMLKPGFRPLSVRDIGKTPQDSGMPFVVISDGEVIPEGLALAGINRRGLLKLLRDRGISAERVFYMTVDKTGGSVVIEKEERQ